MTRKLILMSGLMMLLSGPAVMAGVDFGPNISWSNPEGPPDGDWGVGARLDFGGQLRGIIAFDYFFTDAEGLFDDDDIDSDNFDLKFWEVNGNVVYAVPTTGFHPYFGGGIGFARRTFNDIDNILDDERTEVGYNVLGGIKFGEDPVQGFIEARATFYSEDDDDDLDLGDAVRFRDRFIISGGILF